MFQSTERGLLIRASNIDSASSHCHPYLLIQKPGTACGKLAPRYSREVTNNHVRGPKHIFGARYIHGM